MEQDVKACIKCQIKNRSTGSKIGMLRPLLILKQNFQLVSIDFMIGISNVGKFNASMIIVYELNMWVIFIL